jgi:hypothetical protein
MLTFGAVLVAGTSVPDTVVTLLMFGGIPAVAATSIVTAR